MQCLDGMQQKGWELEGAEDEAQALLAVAEVIFEMIALIFEGVVAVVLNFPAGAAGLGEGGHRGGGDGMVGRPGVVKHTFTSLFMGDGQFQPTDSKLARVETQQEVTGPAIDPAFAKPAIPHAVDTGLEFTGPFQGGDFVKQRAMGLRLDGRAVQ